MQHLALFTRQNGKSFVCVDIILDLVAVHNLPEVKGQGHMVNKSYAMTKSHASSLHVTSPPETGVATSEVKKFVVTVVFYRFHKKSD